MNKDIFARLALQQIPKILTLCDRNPHSPTYGCFDRTFWHYKVVDFPSGMSQEFVWPLALAYHSAIADNPFYHQENLRAWVEAGIIYAARSAHANGSCDDYFPYERAAGAAAFSLLACVESYQLFDLDNYEVLKFFERRANWLADHHESGQLTNHQALIVLCLERVGALLQTDRWDRAKAKRLERVFSWQNEEGWFQEYEGCDPGYHTLTISCLAQVYQSRPDDRLKQVLEKAIELAAQFVHPDGSYGGEYTSRNTYNFFPHGFEVMGREIPVALQINDRFLQGLDRGLGPCYADDRILGHHTWNYLLAWRDFVPERPESLRGRAGRVWLKQAKLLIDRRMTRDEGVQDATLAGDRPTPDVELYLALNKGGVFKLFKNGKLLLSDTQFSVKVLKGKKFKNAVGHLVDDYEVEVREDEILIQGKLGWAKQQQMTPFKAIVLRSVMLSFGRFFPNLIRRILQKMLITGKNKAPFDFIRRLRWNGQQWEIIDELIADSWNGVKAVGIGADQTSIYVVMSRTFQPGQLQPWLDLSDRVQSLSPGDVLRVERRF
ncbi:hypothetical protein [Oxynema aestuarii]|uniref:Uncharacterized protein n=1 Tax=Oxynema aestuarii AP17 TaxID=2064643 RepID=A0A6H1U3A4_9CYAN|nr:hypothetical protein [Oxynema aestuarii]QIZ72640.1 hypothetical protein HCG48_20285 [Oxynema aestuarii AP17]